MEKEELLTNHRATAATAVIAVTISVGVQLGRAVAVVS